ncbi:MAG: hypothetical protein Q9190_001855 [Brigantiaea leucoxantha]
MATLISPATTTTRPTDDLSSLVHDKHKTLSTRLHLAASAPATTSDSSIPTIPLVDVGPYLSPSCTPSETKHIASQIRTACQTTGFFRIQNHGIPASALSDILLQARRFFHDLPLSRKEELHIRNSSLFRGWEKGSDTSVDGEGKGEETKEGFNWGYERAIDLDGGVEGYVELDGLPPNKGRENVWPREEELPGFKQGVGEYYTHVMRLARKILGLFAVSLGLEENWFEERGVMRHPGGIGRLLYYPPASPSAIGDKGQLGLGAHTDYECFTLLFSSGDPGLEILVPAPTIEDAEREVWVPAPVDNGEDRTLMINVADFLSMWTGGEYRSAVHRVVINKGARERYSVPFFFSVDYDALVEPMPLPKGGEGEGEKRVKRGDFKPVRAGEWVLERLKATV